MTNVKVTIQHRLDKRVDWEVRTPLRMWSHYGITDNVFQWGTTFTENGALAKAQKAVEKLQAYDRAAEKNKTYTETDLPTPKYRFNVGFVAIFWLASTAFFFTLGYVATGLLDHRWFWTGGTTAALIAQASLTLVYWVVFEALFTHRRNRRG